MVEQVVNDAVLQQVGREIALRVRIDEEDLLTKRCDCRRDVQCESGLSYATLVIEYCDALGVMPSFDSLRMPFSENSSADSRF